METLAETKLLDCNLEKSCYVVMGSKKARCEVNKKLDEKPLLLCGKPMQRERQGKYLGDWLSEDGLTASAASLLIRGLEWQRCQFLKLEQFLRTVGVP